MIGMIVTISSMRQKTKNIPNSILAVSSGLRVFREREA